MLIGLLVFALVGYGINYIVKMVESAFNKDFSYALEFIPYGLAIQAIMDAVKRSTKK